MIRNTLLAASALGLSALAIAPPAQSQNSTFFLYCVELQSSWAANIIMDARDSAGTWNNIYYVVTDPGRRCQRGQPGATQVRFTIRGNVGGPLRQLCQVTGLGDRAATLQVSGTQENPSCVLVQ
ncbi:hypothetical protein KTR66_10935 [Roseococcus sp. SDR]|uniref:hypothetical protein n=1 Tax=Roseococcus sp. SDR TaxID=2835532 RepID=UPI001BCC07CF|nr:hypothetical protein [Roseococcus sp. SDR]MBS7790514.1 hypothetical protein [Roseococcus sp. SDR]MBV1845828.1 hypothetical protein [Roseococcus sp. SDR]